MYFGEDAKVRHDGECAGNVFTSSWVNLVGLGGMINTEQTLLRCCWSLIVVQVSNDGVDHSLASFCQVASHTGLVQLILRILVVNAGNRHVRAIWLYLQRNLAPV